MSSASPKSLAPTQTSEEMSCSAASSPRSSAPETLADIIHEILDFTVGWGEDVKVTVKAGLIYGWGQRLKSAAEREREVAKMAERDTRREREQDRRRYSKVIARLEDKLAELVRENDLLRAENKQRENDVAKANRKIERLSCNIASELKHAIVEILDRTNLNETKGE